MVIGVLTFIYNIGSFVGQIMACFSCGSYSFTMRKMPFRSVKGGLLPPKRSPFAILKIRKQSMKCCNVLIDKGLMRIWKILNISPESIGSCRRKPPGGVKRTKAIFQLVSQRRVEVPICKQCRLHAKTQYQYDF